MRLLWVAMAMAPVVAAHAAEEGLVGYWRFDAAGAQVQDLSGNGHVATVTGGEFTSEGDRRFLRLDGKTRVEIPSAADLNLKRGFSIETRVRPTDLSDGRLLVGKADEYLLRIDWPVETSRLSFFVNLEKAWEPRVSVSPPDLNVWRHVVATWDGTQLMLWVNGVPQATLRRGEAPPPTTNPVLIGTNCGLAGGFVGDIEFVKLYSRALSSADVIRATFLEGAPPAGPPTTVTRFDFREGPQGWASREGAEARMSPEGLTVSTPTVGSLVMHGNLKASIDKKDFLSLRMAVDKGTRASAIFITTKGAGRITFQTFDDGRMHTYIMEPWQYIGWGGDLLALGLMPADLPAATARLAYVRVTEEPEGEGEVRVTSVFPEAVLPRAGQPQKIIARMQNMGALMQNVKVSLRVPRGVELRGAAEQTAAEIGYQEERELSWTVRAAKEMEGEFRVAAAGAEEAVTIRFAPELHLPKAAYVPEPVPVKTGPYRVWTHYCPLWKHGTHYGWKVIEPYPERKPVLGWYNEGTPEVADWHIKYWLEHGISGVIYCWYRSTKNGPVTQNLGHAIHDGLLKAKYLPQIEFGIMWENGCGEGVSSVDDLMDNVLPFWLDNYFTHPSYLKIDGKPVLYVWVPGNVTRDLGGSDKVRETFEAMRAKCRERGLPGLYIVGCWGGADKGGLARMAEEGWDASSAYGNGWHYPKEMKTVGSFTCAPVEGFVDQQEAIWKAKNGFGLLPDITAAMMGWDSRPWNETSFFWSDNTPEKFRDLCLRAKAVMDGKSGTGPDKNTLIFCCWNEFGEGHYIEPTRGYGFAYPDVIRDVFGQGPPKHTDLAPEDVGLGPYDSWYQEARSAAALSRTTEQTSWVGEQLAAWTGFMGLAEAKVTDGVLHAKSITPDPAFSAPPLKIRGSRFTKVVVEMRVSQSGGAQLFWTTAAEPGTSEAASAHVQTTADGEFHRYAFDVGGKEHWGGCVTSLRFDPTNAAGVNIEVRRIELE